MPRATRMTAVLATTALAAALSIGTQSAAHAASALYAKLVTDGVSFYQVQRDGPNVIAGALDRKPSHLDDKKASVYKWPDFAPDGSDTITDGDLTKTGAARDVSGGWFDAGDF